MGHKKPITFRPMTGQSGGNAEIQPKRSFFHRYWWMGFIAVILLCAIVAIKTVNKNSTTIETIQCTTYAAPDPATNGITWTLPDCASDIRITFPYSMEEVFDNLDTGLTGYGVHAGQHIEGLDHVWIQLKHGTPIRSWADGTVVKVDVSGDIEQSEIQVTIDYGHNLYGVHMELKSSLLTVGDKVTEGQSVGVGFEFNDTNNADMATSGEFALIDLNRDDGIYDFFDSPSTVSPYDYLTEPGKTNLISAYRANYLEPYLEGKTVSYAFHPYQPYLTNQLMLHTADKTGKLTGEWYSMKTDPSGDKHECLTFIEVDNPFYTGNLVLSRNDNISNPYSGIQGTFDVDYDNNRIIITENYPSANQGNNPLPIVDYGIFEIDESGGRAILKIEYQQGAYPVDFSSNALVYILRDNGVGRKNGD